MKKKRVDEYMIYITGDCHGNFERFNASIFPEQNEMTKADCIIICGDFGGVWNKDEESKVETMVLDWLDCKLNNLKLDLERLKVFLTESM